LFVKLEELTYCLSVCFISLFHIFCLIFGEYGMSALLAG